MADVVEETTAAADAGSASSTKKKLKTEQPLHKQQQQQQQQQGKSPKNPKEYAKMLESFWKLSEYNEHTRAEGTRQLVKYFGQLESGEEASNYVLTRLVKGLASNRKCSRLGFAACLTEVINSSSRRRLSFDELMRVAKANLTISSDKSAAAANSLTKEELRNMNIGLLFVYLAWIQSNRLLDETDDDMIATIRTIATDLNSMRKDTDIKAYTRQLYLQGLIILLKKLSSNNKLYETELLAILGDDLKTPFDDKEASETTTENPSSLVKNKDDLNLLLACLNTYTSETQAYLKSNSLKAKHLFNSSSHEGLFEIVSQSSESLPNLQPICVELLTYLIAHQSSAFASIWSSLVDERLSGVGAKKDPKKKMLAIKLLLLALELTHKHRAHDQDAFSTLVESSENILRSFVANYSNRQSNLSEVIRDELSKRLAETVRIADGCGGVTVGAELIIKLISHARNYHDISDLISALIHAIKRPSLNKLFTYFTHDLLNDETKSTNETAAKSRNNEEQEADRGSSEEQLKREQMSSKQVWMLTQLSAMARNRSLYDTTTSNDGEKNSNDELIEKILSYFISNAYFELDATLSGERVLNSLRDRLFELVGVLFSMPPSRSRLAHVAKSIDTFEKLFKSKSKQLREKYLKRKSDLEQFCSRISKLLKKILNQLDRVEGEEKTTTTHNQKADLEAILHTFFMVVIVEFIRSFESFKTSRQAIDDVEICLDEFVVELAAEKGEKKQAKSAKNKTDAEIYWLDVLLEMLLNLITINTTWIRNSVKALFKKLIPRLKVSSVKLIVDLLNPEAEQEMMFEDDSEQEEEDDDNDEDNENEDEEMSDDSEASDKNNKLHEMCNGGEKKLNGKSSSSSNKMVKNEDEESGIEDVSLSESSLCTSTKKKTMPSTKTTTNGNGKKRKREEEDDSNDDDDDDDDESDDEQDEEEVDQELKSALQKVLGNAALKQDGNDDEEDKASNSDLDDEAMLKLDETIAQAFRARTNKDKSQQQKEIIQYKSRVLDFVQELFKSTYRLDLTTYLIKPMFELLFETQTKANLKFLSQRILDFLMNVKHSTRKINESKLPTVDDLFQLLSQLIQFSTTHFNVTNTLVETSMFCVRLIVHESSSCKSEEQKSIIIKRLNEIYSDIIKNEKPKVNPNMYKEYLVRYPAYSIPLVIQMIDSVSSPDVKLHKKTTTLVTLYQCVNNQMFNACENKQITDLFIEKIFKFFDQIMDDILKHESFHIKFVDAFVNLATRVLNLPKNLFKKELNEKLASKLVQLSKEAKLKQAYKSCFQNLVQICNRSLLSQQT